MKLYSRALTATEVAAVRDELDARYSEYLYYSAIGNIADKSDQAYTYGTKPHAGTAGVALLLRYGEGQRNVGHWRRHYAELV